MKKKNLVLMTLALLIVSLPMNAQKNRNNQQQSFVKKVTSIWNKAKKQVSDTGKDIGEKIGINEISSRQKDVDLVEVDGKKYMREAFTKRYPNAKILYAVVPQKDWLNTVLKNGDSVVGYRREAYCFIVAKDGSDGYLNARFLFSADRKVGGEYMKNNSWPRWERTDVLPNQVYDKLIQQQ